tara:strand:+ start:524 stop:676 length:153 start_codon:yes stop_codon:yes gene_type:complete
MSKPKKCTVDAKITFDNGDCLEFDFPNMKPDVAVAMVELFNAHKLEPTDG